MQTWARSGGPFVGSFAFPNTWNPLPPLPSGIPSRVLSQTSMHRVCQRRELSERSQFLREPFGCILLALLTTSPQHFDTSCENIASKQVESHGTSGNSERVVVVKVDTDISLIETVQNQQRNCLSLQEAVMEQNQMNNWPIFLINQQKQPLSQLTRKRNCLGKAIHSHTN